MIKTNKQELLIGLISDTHVPTRAKKIPEVIINDFLEKTVDYIFHLGDFTSIETYEFLIETFGKERVFAVIGNMDAGSKELRITLSKTIELGIFGRKIFMTHGSGGPNMIIRRLNKTFDLSNHDIIIFGHTHHPINEINEKDGKLYINPGTCTPVDGRLTVISSYGFLKISKEDVEVQIIEL